MKVVVALLKLVGLVLLFGVIALCSPVNRTHNSGNIKTRGKFDYSKLALIIHSNSSVHETSTSSVITSTDTTTAVNNNWQDDTGLANNLNGTVSTTESEINDNLDVIPIEKNTASSVSSSSEKNVENIENFRTSLDKTNINDASNFNTSFQRIGEDNYNVTTNKQSDNINSNEKEIKTKSTFSFVSLQQSLGEPSNFSKTFSLTNVSFQTNFASLEQGNKNISNSDVTHSYPEEQDKSITPHFNTSTVIQSNNPLFPSFPFPMLSNPTQFSNPENVYPFPFDFKTNFNVSFEYPDLISYVTDTIETVNEDGTFHFTKHFNDGSSENIESYFQEENGDSVFYIKGYYTINLPNGETSSVSYVIDDKGCITWLT